VLLIAHHFVISVKENKNIMLEAKEELNGWEFNGDDEVMQYWRGVFDTCQYFKNELGIEDAMNTNMAQEAIAYLFETE
tara:strand:+ start:473 stop:706 length:234 start_codon:yes stop_codon:yes gene_type:complete